MRFGQGGRDLAAGNGALNFLGFLFIWDSGSGTSWEHWQCDNELQLLPGAQTQTDRQCIGSHCKPRGPTEASHRLSFSVLPECVWRLGLMHLGSDGAWEAEKGQRQLRRRTNGCHPFPSRIFFSSSGKVRDPGRLEQLLSPP